MQVYAMDMHLSGISYRYHTERKNVFQTKTLKFDNIVTDICYLASD